MDRVITEKLVRARKDYTCDACYWWNRSGYTAEDCGTDDQRLIVQAAEADGFMIRRGQMYRRVTGMDGGEFVTYRARPGMDSVCTNLELFQDD